MVVGKDFFIRERGIGYIAFQTIPCRVFLKSFKIDAYIRLSFNSQIFVVASIIYVLLSDLAGGYLCLESQKPSGAVESIFLLALFCKCHNTT